jgi:hypothetical protein
MKIRILVVALFVLVFVSMSYAGDVNGKWKSKMVMQDGNELELTFTFKANGDTLSGSVSSTYGIMPIYNGKIIGDEFSYQIDVNGNTMTNLGKITGDKIKMTAKDFPMELELTRIVEASKINGAWLGKVPGPDGEMEITLTFAVEGEKLTGSNKSAMGEIQLQNGKVNGDEFTFDIDLGGSIINHKCKYTADDTVDLKVFAMGQEFPMTLTRKK